MGTKDKFWFRAPDDPQECDWLFKFPTENTGQHWAEKVSYEIARRMRILAPRVELAQYCEQGGERNPGSAVRSFSSGYELYHGNQILAGLDENYDPDQRFGHSMHTVQRIFHSMSVFESDRYADRCRARLAEYLILDAVIGNVDRHHENWGILCKVVDGRLKGRLAPTFDHASSLGRELLDTGSGKSRHRFLTELGIDRYAERAPGAVFIGEDTRRGPSPLELMRWGVEQADYGRFFRTALTKLGNLDMEGVQEIVFKIPSSWMTGLAREFVVRLVNYNLDQLQLLV
ncbi:MAG: HipA domain-containing protein [Spirochaetaceae bacterium]|nr:HipA domain-containing protein [Spirochaetaceae bacterium]